VQRACKTSVDLKSFGESAVHEFRRDKQSRTGAVRIGLESARPFVWASFHDSRMAAFQKCRQFVKAPGKTGHFALIGDYLPGAQDIISIVGTSFRNVALEDNIRGLIDSELSPLDEVREVGFKEREGKAILRARETRHRRASRQLCKEALE
jgi:hypothetical protein